MGAEYSVESNEIELGADHSLESNEIEMEMVGGEYSLENNEIETGVDHSLERNEFEMENVPEEYVDAISHQFAYDPVRLPVDQDATQRLYNRKTLETIWETKCHAQNPFTKQWFSARSAISQRELRPEMEDYIKLFPVCRGSKLELIEDYNKILEEGEMKQYLDVLGKSLPKTVTTEKQCLTIWKQINLLRLYCQYHSKNIETFRSLHGFRYLNEFIIKMTMLMRSNRIGRGTKETAWDVCKEISRAIDFIGLKPEDIHDVESCRNLKSKQIVLIESYIKMIERAYINNESYAKIQSLMLRLFSKIFSDMNVEAKLILGKKEYERIVAVTGRQIVKKKFSSVSVEDISSEDLYHGISILQKSRNTTLSSLIRSHVLVDAINICIAREINRSEDTTGLSEAQLLDAQADAQYNLEALEKGVFLVKDILYTEGPSAANLVGGGVDIVIKIVQMFKHFNCEDENENESNGPLFCEKKGCKIFECIHSRIAQLALDISTATLVNVEELPDYEVLFKFLN